MIDISTLRKEDIGKWVLYRGNAGELEKGKIKEMMDLYTNDQELGYKVREYFTRFK